MNTNRGIWEDEEVFLGLFIGVAKEGGTSSVETSVNNEYSACAKCRCDMNYVDHTIGGTVYGVLTLRTVTTVATVTTVSLLPTSSAMSPRFHLFDRNPLDS